MPAVVAASAAAVRPAGTGSTRWVAEAPTRAVPRRGRTGRAGTAARTAGRTGRTTAHRDPAVASVRSREGTAGTDRSGTGPGRVRNCQAACGSPSGGRGREPAVRALPRGHGVVV